MDGSCKRLLFLVILDDMTWNNYLGRNFPGKPLFVFGAETLWSSETNYSKAEKMKRK
jgi:hypothetical protein